MNARAIISEPIIARDGELPRRRFTYEDVWAMQQAGTLDPDAKLELLEGDLVPMQAKLHKHELIKALLLEHFYKHRPANVRVWAEPSLYLGPDHVPDPDILLTPSGRVLESMGGPDVLLVIEVTDSRRWYDLGRKAELYARYGVPEYWVVDAASRETHVFTGPIGESWRSRTFHAETETLSPTLVAGVSLSIAALLALED